MLDKDQLHELLDELSKMKQMKSAYDGARDQVRLVGRLLGQEDRGKLDAGFLTAAILDFADLPTASLGDARKLLLGIGQSEPAAQVNMGNAVHDLHGQLPDAVFASTAARLQQGATLDMFLNELSAAEEAFYATSEGG